MSEPRQAYRSRRTGFADLAILGGTPLFERIRGTGQLANRDPDRFFELASGILTRRRFTNQGPLVAELEQRLAAFHGARHCIAFANACFPLILSLRALARPGRSKVLLPSLTFRGLPHLIRWAGLEPAYCDVDPVTHTLTPAILAACIGTDTAVVLAADTVSALCDLGGLEEVASAAGIPIVVDSVYGMAGRYGNGQPVGSHGRASVFSLHATKLINGFEGGYLTTSDEGLAIALRRQRTFGFGEDGNCDELGLNAKLNEVHAAMALSNLPHMESIIADNTSRFAAYQESFAPVPWVSFADYSRSAGTYSLVLLKVDQAAPYTRDELLAILRAENAAARPYYSPPLHQMDPAWQGNLPVSERLSREFIQMPAGDLMSIEDIQILAELFSSLDRNAAGLLPELRRRGIER